MTDLSNVSSSGIFNGDDLSSDFPQIYEGLEEGNFAVAGGGCFPFAQSPHKIRGGLTVDLGPSYSKYELHSGKFESPKTPIAQQYQNMISSKPTFPAPKSHIPLLPFSLLSLRKDMLKEMHSKVNFFYELKDARSRQEFLKFNKVQSPSKYLLILLLLFSLFFFPASIAVLWLDLFDSSPNHRTFRVSVSIVQILSSLIAVISGWVMYTRRKYSTSIGMAIFRTFFGDNVLEEVDENEHLDEENDTVDTSIPMSCHVTTKSFKREKMFVTSSQSNFSYLYHLVVKVLDLGKFPFLKSCFVVSMQIFFCTIFLRRVFSLNCQINGSSRFAIMFGSGLCYENDVKLQMISFNALLLVLYPFLYLISVPDIPLMLVWFVFLISIAVYASSAIVLNLSESFPLVFTWMCIGFYAIKDNQLRNLLIFLSHKRMEELVLENQRINELNHANEMRHLISNVAHDLKTVS